MTTDPAVQAAAEAMAPGLCEFHGMEPYSECETCAYLVHARMAAATAAVAAARPVIEREVRDRIAAEIEAEATQHEVENDDWDSSYWVQALYVAARIARGTDD